MQQKELDLVVKANEIFFSEDLLIKFHSVLSVHEESLLFVTGTCHSTRHVLISKNIC